MTYSRGFVRLVQSGRCVRDRLGAAVALARCLTG